MVVDSHSLYRRAEESWLVLDRNIKVIKCDFIISHKDNQAATNAAAKRAEAARANTPPEHRAYGLVTCGAAVGAAVGWTVGSSVGAVVVSLLRRCSASYYQPSGLPAVTAAKSERSDPYRFPQ